jgi:hypothetical protein
MLYDGGLFKAEAGQNLVLKGWRGRGGRSKRIVMGKQSIRREGGI